MFFKTKLRLPWVITLILAFGFLGSNAISLREVLQTGAEVSETSSPVEEESSGEQNSVNFAMCMGRHRGIRPQKSAEIQSVAKITQKNYFAHAKTVIADRAEHRMRNGCGAPLLF